MIVFPAVLCHVRRASFDVTSLYTTIPIDQALFIIKDLLEHDDKLADRALLSPRQILDLLEYSTTHHILQIQWRFLPTNRRSSNGKSNFSRCLEIYMQSLETTAITTADHPPKVWERHVDDVFSIVHKIYLQELLEHINILHPQTQFTKEEETIPLFHSSTS